MAVQRAGVLNDGLETLGQGGEVATRHYLRPVVLNQSQTHPEQNLGALVEQAVPYPEHCLYGKHFGKKTNEPLRCYNSPGKT